MDKPDQTAVPQMMGGPDKSRLPQHLHVVSVDLEDPDGYQRMSIEIHPELLNLLVRYGWKHELTSEKPSGARDVSPALNHALKAFFAAGAAAPLGYRIEGEPQPADPRANEKWAAFQLVMDALCTITDPPGVTLEDAQKVLQDSGQRLAMSVTREPGSPIRTTLYAIRQGFHWDLSFDGDTFSCLVSAFATAGPAAAKP